MTCLEPSSLLVCEDALVDFSRDFREIKEIGSGSFAHVILCESACNGELFAVKRIDKVLLAEKHKNKKILKWHLSLIRNEIEVHRLASAHPNVATLYDVYEDDNHINLVLEYCAGGELFNLLIDDHSIDEDMAANVMKQLCTALKFFHDECDIVHCDIKPSNIMLASKESLEIRIVDFGMARILRPGEHLTYVSGTPHYTAPEVIPTGGKRPRYAHSCDMWSLGVVLFAMIFNFRPFSNIVMYKGKEREIRKAVYRNILRGFLPVVRSTEEFGYGPWFPDSDVSSEGVRDLISSLLRKDVCKRLTAAQVLEHAWVREVADECPSECPSECISESPPASRLSMSLPKLSEATVSEPRRRSDSDESEKQLIREMLLAVAKLSRGCLFREAVAKLYIDEFRSQRPDLYATIVRCFDSMATLGVVDLHSFGCFVAHWGPGHVCAKHVTAMYRELALPAMGEDHADGFRLADIVTAAVIDYIGASQKRLQRVFDELADASKGVVAVDAVVRRLKAKDPEAADWQRVERIIEAQRVDVRSAKGGGIDFVEFLANMDPRYEESPEWAHYFLD